MHLLLVEDDPRLQRVLRRLLEDDRHVVEVAPDGETALELAAATDGIEAVILDVGLPDISGLEVAARLRKDGHELAILMLTARDTVNDRVAGLDAGADDYLVKPFAYEELAARLRALARRAEPGARRPDPVLAAGPIALDERSRRVTVDGRRSTSAPASSPCWSASSGIRASPSPATSSSTRPGRSRSPSRPNAVDAYVHYLRTKLGGAGTWIQTVRGVGYRLADG